MTPAALPRAAAALIALVAFGGLGAQLVHSTGTHGGSVALALWSMSFFFTIITNSIVAVVFTLIALGRAIPPWITGGCVLAILLVGIVYALLLSGLMHLTGGARTADLLLHRITPVLVPLWWLAFAPRGALRGGDPLRWALLPLTYFAYGLVRGELAGRYPYPFMNPVKIGWDGVIAYALAMAAGFLLFGYALVWFDGRRRRAA